MTKSARRRQALTDLAGRQHGVVARRQVLALGLASTTIVRLASEGYLHPVLEGVYVLGHRTMTRETWFMACALAGGPYSALAARAGAAVWELLPATTSVDVIVTRRQAVHLPGIRAHRCALARADRVVHHGLPVTSVGRTLLDLAGSEPPARVAEALDQALLQRRYDHAEMLAVLARYPGRRGVRALRKALDRLGDEPDRFRSGTERRARDLIVTGGIERPEVNAWFATAAGHGHELDLYFRRLRLNVEIDGPQHRCPGSGPRTAGATPTCVTAASAWSGSGWCSSTAIPAGSWPRSAGSSPSALLHPKGGLRSALADVRVTP